MLKKAHYTTFKKQIIIELQKTVEGIFNLELVQFKAKSAIPLPQTTAAIMILKPQYQRIHIWRHHSGTYYQQPLIQQQLLIMGNRLTSFQAFPLKR